MLKDYSQNWSPRKMWLFSAHPSLEISKKNFPQSISGAPVILPTYDSKLRQDIDHWAKLNKVELNIIIESQDISVKKLLAINELGLIASATHAIAEQASRDELVEIGQLKGVYEELFMVTAQRKLENPIAAKLRDLFNV